MRSTQRLAAFAVLPVLALAGCARGRCCAEPREAAIAPLPKLLPPDARDAGYTAKDVQTHKVLLQAVVLSVPTDAVLRESAARDLATTGGTRMLTKEDSTALQSRLAAERGIQILQLPSIVTEAGQEATIFVGETYPRDARDTLTFDVDRPDWAGHRFRAVATPSADGSSLALEFSFALRDLPATGSSPNLTAIAAGEVRESATVNLPKGSSLLVVAKAGTGTPKDRVLVIVDARLISAADRTSR